MPYRFIYDAADADMFMPARPEYCQHGGDSAALSRFQARLMLDDIFSCQLRVLACRRAFSYVI